MDYKACHFFGFSYRPGELSFNLGRAGDPSSILAKEVFKFADFTFVFVSL